MRIYALIWLTVSLLFGFTQPLFAQYSETISSDRPGMSYAANTVGSRVMQFQVGGDFISNLFSNRYVSREYGGAQIDALIRVGVLERFEVGFPIYYRSTRLLGENPRNEPPANSFSYGLNLRGNVLQSNGKTPNISMLAEVRLPDANAERYAEGISQTFLLMIEQPLEERIRLSSNIGMVRHSVANFVYTLNLSVDVSPKATIFVEHYGSYFRDYNDLYREDKAYDFWYGKVNAGFSFALINDLQIDVQGGWGSLAVTEFNNTNTDWYFGMGLSYRVRFKKREPKENPKS